MNDLLLSINEVDVGNFADDTTLYKCGRDLELFFHRLEMDPIIEIHLLKNNEMAANPKKFQLILLVRNKNIEAEMYFAGKNIKSPNTVELSGMTLEKNINFKSHIENICCKFRRANFLVSQFTQVVIFS